MGSNKESMIKKLGSLAAYQAYMSELRKKRTNYPGVFPKGSELAKKYGAIGGKISRRKPK